MDVSKIVQGVESELNDQGRSKEQTFAFDEAMKLLSQAQKSGDADAIAKVNDQLHKDGFLSDVQIIAAKYDEKTQTGELVLRFKEHVFGIDDHGQPVAEHPEGPVCQTPEQEKRQKLETYSQWAGAQFSELDADKAQSTSSNWHDIVSSAPAHGRKDIPSHFTDGDGGTKKHATQIDAYRKDETGMAYHEQYSLADGKGNPQLVLKETAFETRNKSRVLITEQPGAPPRVSVSNASGDKGYEFTLTDSTKLADTIKEVRWLEN